MISCAGLAVDSILANILEMRSEDDVLDDEADARQEEGFDSDYQGSEDAAVDEGSGSGNDYSEGDDGHRPKRRKIAPVKPSVPAIDSAQTRKLRSRDPPVEDGTSQGSAAAGAVNHGRTHGAQRTAHMTEGRTRGPLHRSGQAAGGSVSVPNTTALATAPHPHHIAPQLHPAGCSDHSYPANNGSSAHHSTTSANTVSLPGGLPGSHSQTGLNRSTFHSLNTDTRPPANYASLQASQPGTNHATLTATGRVPAQNHTMSAHLPHDITHSRTAAAGLGNRNTFASADIEDGWEGPGRGDSDQEGGEGAYDDEDNYRAVEEVIPERVMSEEEVIASTAAVTAMWQLTAVVECLSIFSPWMFSQGGFAGGCALFCSFSVQSLHS